MNDESLLNLRYWKELISRRRWLIVGCVVGVSVLAGVFSLVQKPIYEATCRLYLNRPKVQPINFQDIYTKQTKMPSDVILTQIEILRSTSIVERAVKDVEQKGALNFADDKRPAKLTWVERVTAPLRSNGSKGLLTAEEKRMTYVTALKRELLVQSSGGGAFLLISVPYGRPQVAADLANAIAGAYLRNDREMLRRSADEAIEWLTGKVSEQRAKLLLVEDQLRAYAGGQAPSAEEMGTLAVQEMTRLQQALLDVRLRLLQAETQGILAKAASPGSAPQGGADSVEADLNRALRERVKRDLVDTLASLSLLRQRYGERHPDVLAAADKEKQLRQQLTTLEAAAPQELTPMGSGALGSTGRMSPADVEGLKAQERLLRESIDKSLQATLGKGQEGMRYAILKREVEIQRSLFNEMQARLNQLTISAGLDTATAEVFEAARPPFFPVSPDHPRNLMLGLLAGLIVGLGAAAVQDHFDQSLRDPGQANDLLRAPVLGMIPHHGRMPVLTSGQTRGLVVGLSEETPAAEAYRVLCSHIEGAVTPEESAVLLVTSAVAGEGKSTTAANLSAAFAASGRRVLLVDGDFRRPILGSYFKLDRKTCLSHVLRGEKPPDVEVRPSGVANMDILGCQPGSKIPDGKKTTDRFKALFDWARDHYDRIVVDMPVVMVAPGVTEAARAGASVLLVHRPGWVPAPVLEQVRDHFALSRTRLVGVVLNAIQARWVAGQYPILRYYTASGRTGPGREGTGSGA